MFSTQLKKLITVFGLGISLSCQGAITVKTMGSLGHVGNDHIIVDEEGNAYVSNIGGWNGSGFSGSNVEKMDPEGIVSLYATGFGGPGGLALDSDGNLYVGNFNSDSLDRVSPSGQVENVIPHSGMTVFDSEGNGYVANYFNSRVYKFDTAGRLSVFSQSPLISGPTGIGITENDEIYLSNYEGGQILKLDSEGNATQIARISSGSGAVSYMTYMSGYLYATSLVTHKVYQISLAGEVTEIAGTGRSGYKDGAAEEAQFAQPNGIAPMPNGTSLALVEFRSPYVRIVELNDQSAEPLNFTQADAVSLDEDGTVEFNPLENDEGYPESVDAATVSVVSQPQHGTVTEGSSAGMLVYQPDANFNGEDSFSYRVSNDEGRISFDTAVTIQVASVNDAPVAEADSYNTAANTAVAMLVLDNDADIEESELSYSDITIESEPSSGTLEVQDTQLQYTPNTDFSGSDEFSYAVHDSQGAASEAVTVTIEVAAAPTPPTPAPPVTPAPPQPEPDNGSGGSFGWLILGVLGLAFVRRSNNKSH